MYAARSVFRHVRVNECERRTGDDPDQESRPRDRGGPGRRGGDGAGRSPRPGRDPPPASWTADLSTVDTDDVNVAATGGALTLADAAWHRTTRVVAGSEGSLITAEHALATPANRVSADLTADAPKGTSVEVDVRGRTGADDWTEWTPAGTTLKTTASSCRCGQPAQHHRRRPPVRPRRRAQRRQRPAGQRPGRRDPADLQGLRHPRRPRRRHHRQRPRHHQRGPLRRAALGKPWPPRAPATTP